LIEKFIACHLSENTIAVQLVEMKYKSNQIIEFLSYRASLRHLLGLLQIYLLHHKTGTNTVNSHNMLRHSEVKKIIKSEFNLLDERWEQNERKKI
jgi:hypothetical protein